MNTPEARRRAPAELAALARDLAAHIDDTITDPRTAEPLTGGQTPHRADAIRLQRALGRLADQLDHRAGRRAGAVSPPGPPPDQDPLPFDGGTYDQTPKP